MEEYHAVLALFNSHAEVDYPREKVRELGKFVIMGREKYARLGVLLPLQKFDYRPGDA